MLCYPSKHTGESERGRGSRCSGNKRGSVSQRGWLISRGSPRSKEDRPVNMAITTNPRTTGITCRSIRVIYCSDIVTRYYKGNKWPAHIKPRQSLEPIPFYLRDKLITLYSPITWTFSAANGAWLECWISTSDNQVNIPASTTAVFIEMSIPALVS